MTLTFVTLSHLQFVIRQYRQLGLLRFKRIESVCISALGCLFSGTWFYDAFVLFLNLASGGVIKHRELWSVCPLELRWYISHPHLADFRG